MKKYHSMRPQDIVILLKMTTDSKQVWLNAKLAESLKISPSEISGALERCRVAKLVDHSKRRVNIKALEEFIIHGLKYVFPVEPQGMVRGIPTAFSASPIREKISQGREKYVWPYVRGTERGQLIEPLYSTIPDAVVNDPELYELLAIADTLRIGKVREIEVAKEELKKRFDQYGRN